jgi:hypothetical protein
MITDPHGYTLFCDDVRQEKSGKMIHIGVYGRDLLTYGDFPVALPKFCFVVSVVVPVEKRDMTVGMSFRIYIPGDKEDEPSFVFETDSTPLPPPDPELLKKRPEHFSILEGPILARANFNFTVSPMILREPGTIKVRGIFNTGDVVYLGALHVSQAPAGASHPTALPPPSGQSPPDAQGSS